MNNGIYMQGIKQILGRRHRDGFWDEDDDQEGIKGGEVESTMKQRRGLGHRKNVREKRQRDGAAEFHGGEGEED